MDRDGSRSTAAPTPGDPRSVGARPNAVWRDLAWGALGVGLILVTALQFVALAVALVRLEVAPSGGGLFLGFVITVVWLLTISWLVMGAWRRTVWGCPFEHTDLAPAARRCPRHASAELPTDGGA